MINSIKGGVTAAKGFKAACCAAGIKYKGRTDMAMIYSDAPCAVAGTFTRNVVKAAPVIWDKQIVENVKKAQAVVVNAEQVTDLIGNRLCTGDTEVGLDAALGNDIRRFHTGISYRHCLIWKNGDDHYDFSRPHDIIGRCIRDYLPSEENGGGEFYRLMKESYDVLNYTRAKNNLEKVVAMDAKYKSGEALYLLVDIYVNQKETEKAKTTYEKLVSLYPDTDVAKRASEKMQTIKTNENE